MERLKKLRSVTRSTFTKTLNSLNTLLQDEQKDNLGINIKATLRLLENKWIRLDNAYKQLYDLMLKENATEEELLTEETKRDEYMYLYETAKLAVQSNEEIRVLDNVSMYSHNNNGNTTSKRRYKLPQIELVKFDGELINWLQFWSQFSKIHNDTEVAPEDKIQYLLQIVDPGSRAYELVHSFPATGENYEKVITSLKARFGRDDLVVEVYVRELLKIVLQNVLSSKKQVTSLQSLYDKLECHLRALDTLGVTTDKCAAMLFPLVESCMPEELLKAWQRSPFRIGDDPKARLDNLMKFMLSEVEGEQRICLAMSGFGVNQNQPSKERPNKRL